MTMRLVKFTSATNVALQEPPVYVDADLVRGVTVLTSDVNFPTCIYQQDSDLPFIVKESIDTVIAALNGK
jgi:hypothetical protein